MHPYRAWDAAIDEACSPSEAVRASWASHFGLEGAAGGPVARTAELPLGPPVRWGAPCPRVALSDALLAVGFRTRGQAEELGREAQRLAAERASRLAEEG